MSPSFFPIFDAIAAGLISGCIIAAIQAVRMHKAIAVFAFLAIAFFSSIFLVVLHLNLPASEAVISSDSRPSNNFLSSELALSSAPGRMTREANSAPISEASTKTENVDAEKIKDEISDKIFSWKSSSEEHDFDSHMSCYADRVDYYRKKNASWDFVRNDRQRAFKLYDIIRIYITNLNINVTAGGDTATAYFDKEWDFNGFGKTSKGKVFQQLSLIKIGGRWFISGEKDLKVY